MITIDKEKCIGCGQCVEVCPFTVLALDEDRRAYHTGKSCIKCMHCAAICPKTAITYDNESVICEEVKALPDTCAETVEQMVRQRRSYRRFKEKRVDRNLIRGILDTADLVPSAKNQHPVHWTVVEDRTVLDRIMEYILEFCGREKISMEIIEEYKNGNNPVIGENASVLIGYCFGGAINPACDTAIALTTVELMMQSNKIGTCWGGYLGRFVNLIPECRTLLGLPDDATVYGTLLFGYPKQQDYRYVPERLDKAEIRFI